MYMRWTIPPFLHGSHYQVAFPCPGPRISLDALRSRPPRRETALAVEHVGWARFEGKKIWHCGTMHISWIIFLYIFPGKIEYCCSVSWYLKGFVALGWWSLLTSVIAAWRDRWDSCSPWNFHGAIAAAKFEFLEATEDLQFHFCVCSKNLALHLWKFSTFHRHHLWLQASWPKLCSQVSLG